MPAAIGFDQRAAIETLGPHVTVRGVAPVPLETAWERFVPIKLPLVFPKAKGPIPAVVDVRDQTGRWDLPGRSRTVVLANGATVREVITLSEPPYEGRAAFGYEVTGFSGPIGLLARSARGLWTFHADAGRTRIDWTYGFEPTGVIARPMLALIVSTFWRSYMHHGLSNTVAVLGAEPGARPAP